jgi:Ca2+-transporting ATPase
VGPADGVGIKTPFTPALPDAVQMCRKAEMVVRMDCLRTATAIAEQARLLAPSGTDAIEGIQYWALSNKQLDQEASHLELHARSSPDD